MKSELRDKILAFNRTRVEDAEKAADFMVLLSALPPGQAKNLLKDPVCGPVLSKYGVTGGEDA